MKKLLSVFLTLAMMLTMLSLPLTSVSAVEPESSEIYDTSKAVNGVLTLDDGDYTVINEANKSLFMNMTGDNKYILGADLDFTVDGAPTAWSSPIKWWGVLEGNGHKVTGFSVTGGGMFDWNAETTISSTIKIANITFGASDALISVNGVLDDNSTGLLASHIRKNGKNIELLVENVQAYIDVARASGASNKVGGLIGQIRQTTVTFQNCLVDGRFQNGNPFQGGYIGLVGIGNVAVSFENCVNRLDLASGTTYSNRGGFVGFVNDRGGVISVSNCINEGDIVASGSAVGVAAIVGGISANGNSAPLSVGGFLNLGTITATVSDPAKVGVVVGTLSATSAISV